MIMITKREKRREENKEKKIALFEIFLLIASILAFAYFIGEEFELVSAADVELPIPEPETLGEQIVENLVKEVFSVPTVPPSSAPVFTPTFAEPAVEAAEAGAATTGTPWWKTFGGKGFGQVPEPIPGGATVPKTPFFQTTIGAGIANIIGNAAIAYGLYAITKWIWSLTSWDPALGDQLAKDLSIGYGIGAGAGIIGNLLFPNAGLFGAAFSLKLPLLGTIGVPWLGIIGAAVGLLIWFFTAKEEYTSLVTYSCYPWQPVTGGADCQKCNTGEFPCTKYKCESLGQGCELLNAGTSEEICEWTNRNDVAAPVIEAWKDALTEGYTYVKDNARLPPDKGVTIKNTKSADGCLPPFSRIAYGITVNEPAKCKIDIVRTDTFEKMKFFMSSGYYKYNHSVISLTPEANQSEGALELENGGSYEVFVRCEDKNGNSNVGTFVFKYCIQDEPDTTAPKIVLTNPINGMPVQHGLTSQLTEVYVDKPSTCKWSHSDQEYDAMPETMQCSGDIREINANMLYKCTTTLTGLKDETENKFYFRCKSYPSKNESDRYTNTESYPYKLIGTKPLVIDSISPESGTTIKDSTQTVKVTLEAVTSAGFKDGEAKCYFKEKTESDSGYILFFNTDSYQSSQDLWLTRGTYRYSIRCCDLGGNCATQDTEFTVDTDFVSPIVARAYNEGGNLKIVTEESAECVYDTTSCSYTFEDGIGMLSSDGLAHTTEWNTDNNFYIKCKDEFGNQPAPDGCSIIIRPFDTF